MLLLGTATALKCNSREERVPTNTKTSPHAGHSGFSGLEVACWPLVPKFAGSNPAEAVRCFRAKKFSAHLPSEGQ